MCVYMCILTTSCSLSALRVEFPLLGGKTLILRCWGMPPLEELCLCTIRGDVPCEVLTQINLWVSLGLSTGTEFTVVGFPPLGDQNLMQGFPLQSSDFVTP